MGKIFLALLIVLLSSVNIFAQTYYAWRYRTSADCTALTDGKAQDLCKDSDDGKIYTCVPSSGNCDNSTEWVDVASNTSAQVRYVDTYSEIQTAIDAVQAAGGGTVWILPGTYNITTGLTISCDATTGAGSDNKGFVLRGFGSNTKLVPSIGVDTITVGATGDRCLSVEIRDLFIKGVSATASAGTNSGTGIIMIDPSYSIIENVQIRKGIGGILIWEPADGATNHGTLSNWIIDTQIATTVDYGLKFQLDSNAALNYLNDFRIWGLRLANAGTNALYFLNNGDAGKMTGHAISDSYIETTDNTQVLLRMVKAHANTFTGVTFDWASTSSPEIYIDADSNNNYFTGYMGTTNGTHFTDSSTGSLFINQGRINSKLLVLGGIGGTNNENLKYDFDTVANEIAQYSTTGATKIVLQPGTLQLGADATNMPSSTSQDGSLIFHNELGATDYTTTFNSSASQSMSIVYTLPATSATGTNKFLGNNGSGALSWTSPLPTDSTGVLLNDGSGNLSWTQNTASLTTDTVSGNAWTSDFSAGKKVHYIALANATNTATFSNPTAGDRYVLILKSGGASTAVTWPGTVLWSGGSAPSISTTANKVDIIACVYDSVNTKYYCDSSLNF